MNNIDAQKAEDTHYKNIKEKPYKTNTSTWFNNLCRTYILPATYVFIYALLMFSDSPKLLKIDRNIELWQMVCKKNI